MVDSPRVTNAILIPFLDLELSVAKARLLILIWESKNVPELPGFGLKGSRYSGSGTVIRLFNPDHSLDEPPPEAELNGIFIWPHRMSRRSPSPVLAPPFVELA